MLDTLKETRNYDVVAIPLTIYFNKYGDHDHNAMIYVLEENFANINIYKKYLKDTPDLTDLQKVSHPYYSLIRPLVLRAHVGETVNINFRNEIPDREVGMHLASDGYEVSSDGAWVGDNPNSLVAYDKSKTYEWICNAEGTFVFHDAGNMSGMQDGTNVHGLFGALIVEPAGTRWRDPVSGDAIRDGLYADIIPAETGDETPWLSPPVKYPEEASAASPQKKSFREYVIFFHDEPEFLASHSGAHVMNPCEDKNDICGNPPPPEHASHPIMPVSYRAEPMVSRQKILWKKLNDGELIAPVVHEEQHHSSWLFGDPTTPLLKAYVGDPIRIRLIHAGVKETHVFHLHVYSWHHDALNKKSPIIDAISISPQTGHTIMPLWGAGNRQGAVGDVIWHCHLYPHFHEGMWGMLRTFDCLHEGHATDKYPDDTHIEALKPLPDREPPPRQNADLVGFPNFMAGTPGQRSPLPPWNDDSIFLPRYNGLDYRAPSDKEKNRLAWLAKWVAATHPDWTHLNTNPVPGWMFNSFRLPADGDTPTASDTDVPVRNNPTDITALAVQTDRFKYNRHCWHDPEGHRFFADNPIVLGDAPNNIIVENTHRGRHEFKHADCTPGHGEQEHEEHGDMHHQAPVKSHTPGSGNNPEELADPYKGNFEPLFFRANHGDVVINELENRLPRAFCLSPFDEALPGCEAFSVNVNLEDPYFNGDQYKEAERTPPMQCGLHVHLVKFDPLVADGACTGWNYLSGARAPYWKEAAGKWQYLRMRYIWWVDEEFGVIFTHDHLFANFRQKRGLFGALIAEPQGAVFLDPETHAPGKKIGAEAVIKLRNGESFREFCIGFGDFVPLYNRHNLPLNPPNIPGGHSDHGVVGVNYKSAPVRERTLRPHDMATHNDAGNGDMAGGPSPAELKKREDPAYCFSSHVWFEPETPIFKSLPNEPIRIRLVQGSHEEQHSFQIHGMRWRRFRDDNKSPLKNQQTIGISEAFTFKIEHEYGVGDYMYKFAAADDLWMGAWGIIRVVSEGLLPLPGTIRNPKTIPEFDGVTAKKFEIFATPREIYYCAVPPLSDPFGLVYQLTDPAIPGASIDTEVKPLILRCRQGEWIEVTLHCRLDEHLTPEPAAPEVPVEIFDRPVSSQVSMHADLVHYDVTKFDGANIGRNPEQTVNRGAQYTYRWYAEQEGAALLQDFADFRNHRHHGLIGALIVEPASALIPPDKAGSDCIRISQPEKDDYEEIVLLIQDGLRFFHFGNLSLPMGDPAGDPAPDPTDQGQKAFNYRALPIGKPHWMHLPELFADDFPLRPGPLFFQVPANSRLKVHLLVAGDKPRNHSFTIHGHRWREWETTDSPTTVGSETSLITGAVKTVEMIMKGEGDYAFRSGALRWSVSQGLWGIIRSY